MNFRHKYAHTILPPQFPFALTVTARGCPYQCIFCGAAAVSGRKVRLRSADNVLSEIDHLHNGYGVNEVIFADDHFLASRARAIEIMKGIVSRGLGITWKCVNLNVWHLDRELLELMRESGCYQMTVSIESGNQHVLRNIIKKPGDLGKVPGMVGLAKELGFEVAANFVFGFPGETWDQIRETCRFAEKIEVDLVNFHIATPLPQTELMEIAEREGYVNSSGEDDVHGYTKGVIETSEFKAVELQILRAFEWDRINFSSPARKSVIARMYGISIDELELWRSRTRESLGTTVGWKY